MNVILHAPLVKYIWATPDAEQLIADMARVSAPENIGKDATKLIGYLLKNKHFSPFEMVNMCVEINTTRDIARQLLRHRSFSFQEFSQRYADVSKLEPAPLRECRMQDTKNRQNSLENAPISTASWWDNVQEDMVSEAQAIYNQALRFGIAKEVARAILPEGLTSSRMYMNGTLRSWIHFYELRKGNGTQKETRLVAEAVGTLLSTCFPSIMGALNNE
jgi:thymidylate synthase (FAD)